jgi:hypothetical protein
VPKVKGEAALAVADFIRNPDLFQFDLLENPAIVQLASDSKYGSLHKLLNLVIEGDVEVRLKLHCLLLFMPTLFLLCAAVLLVHCCLKCHVFVCLLFFETPTSSNFMCPLFCRSF